MSLSAQSFSFKLTQLQSFYAAFLFYFIFGGFGGGKLLGANPPPPS